MINVLAIDSSARNEGSLSREMSKLFLKHWQVHRPRDTLIRRDVGTSPPPMLTEAWIAACFTPDEQQTEQQKEVLRYSDEAIDELKRAEVIVVSAPRYNYGMPAALKAWFDQVIRIRRTFSFDRTETTWPLSPLLSGKKLVLLTASGEFGFGVGGIREDREHLESHVRTCAHYIGVARTDLHCVAIEFQEFGDQRHRHSISDAHAKIERLARHLAVVQ
ncbi:FMN-dependent NADH-azoreductase [Scleromatobacter humisilvae]|uniref:FMN dependent NADH:quinone oxidoreductase n=1 Tax=Scleromatobacter humisilvae TaxID=2897159 RepID=A0A9X2C1U6_9BURK|nr:NAD(P)H-dependent oxidoreductase [Scleromatobacter humisilvae]MCK9685370.1 NAD(P)H-dependent oxidoreductase [Scleromatobacter humisilvae]